MCMLSATFERLQVVDFTSFIFLDELTLMSHSPQEKSKNLLILAPFENTVWVFLLFTTFIILGLLKIISLFENYKFKLFKNNQNVKSKLKHST